MNSSTLGKYGEDFAVSVLEAEGCTVLERNFRCRAGEIDIIAEKDGTLYFVEVKTRRGLGAGRPAEAVTYWKQQKTRIAAAVYLQSHGGEQERNCSFHVIEVLYHHISDAF